MNGSLTISQTSIVKDIFGPGTAFDVDDTIHCDRFNNKEKKIILFELDKEKKSNCLHAGRSICTAINGLRYPGAFLNG